MKLTEQALNELRHLLKNEIHTNEKLLTDEDVNTIGVFLLTILLEALRQNYTDTSCK